MKIVFDRTEPTPKAIQFKQNPILIRRRQFFNPLSITPIVLSSQQQNNEIAKYGEFRTKRLVLAEYHRMATAGLTLDNPLVDGENYTSTLTPPPGHGPRHPKAA